MGSCQATSDTEIRIPERILVGSHSDKAFVGVPARERIAVQKRRALWRVQPRAGPGPIHLRYFNAYPSRPGFPPEGETGKGEIKLPCCRRQISSFRLPLLAW